MSGDVASRLAAGDATLFAGTRRRLLARLAAPPRALPRAVARRVRRSAVRGATAHHRTRAWVARPRPPRLYAEARADGPLVVLDTSHPDTVAAIDFTETTVVASSKSGSTIETQTLLAHAFANGLEPEDLVVVTDPGDDPGRARRGPRGDARPRRP